MNKIIKLLLIITTILVLGACSNKDTMSKEDSIKAFETAMKVTSDAEAYRIEGKSDTELVVNNEHLETHAKYSGVLQDIHQDKPLMSLKYSMIGFEESKELELYYVDGRQYSKTMDEKINIEQEFNNIYPLSDELLRLEQVSYDNIVGIKSGDTLVLTLTYAKEEVASILELFTGFKITKGSGSLILTVDSTTNLILSKN